MPRGEEGTLYILSVREHKTAVEGYAKLVLNTTDHRMV